MMIVTDGGGCDYSDRSLWLLWMIVKDGCGCWRYEPLTYFCTVHGTWCRCHRSSHWKTCMLMMGEYGSPFSWMWWICFDRTYLFDINCTIYPHICEWGASLIFDNCFQVHSIKSSTFANSGNRSLHISNTMGRVLFIQWVQHNQKNDFNPRSPSLVDMTLESITW